MGGTIEKMALYVNERMGMCRAVISKVRMHIIAMSRLNDSLRMLYD